MTQITIDAAAKRVLHAWDTTTHNKSADGMLAEEMETLRAAIEQALVLDGWRWVPAKLLDKFPEINTSNYDHDDACELNAWGIEVVLAAQNAAPQPQPKQEPKMHSITADPHRANVEFSGVPAGHSSNHPAGGTSAGTQG
jgi:hypothetical protein